MNEDSPISAKFVQQSVSLPIYLIQTLKGIAREQNTSLSAIIRDAISGYLAKRYPDRQG